MESKPWTIYWFSKGQKREHLSRMQEIQFRETSADTEWIKYNTNGIKFKSSKNIDLLKIKRRQQDSATLLLKSSKSLLQMHERENYCKQRWEKTSDISKYWAISVLQLFVNQALASWNLILILIFLNEAFSIHDQKAKSIT